MFQRILVPVDLTEKSLKAVDLAYEFATSLGSEVVLLYVIETIEHVQFEFEQLKPFYDRLEASARKDCRNFLRGLSRITLLWTTMSFTASEPSKSSTSQSRIAWI
jgi:nucleotide-binding universal stress UspA family protein